TRMHSRILGFFALSALAASGPVAAQQFVQLPPGSNALDITPDGEVVVGIDSNGEGLIWRWRVDPAPTSVPGGYFTAVSDDGTIACGNTTHPGTGELVAGFWSETTGWQSLGWLPGAGGLCGGSMSSAFDISGDGGVVVGLSWESCDARGFLWTDSTGMIELMPLGNGHNRASAISGDGLTIGGFAQGSLARTPAYWSWDATGALINPNLQGEVYGLNYDGSTSVGTLYFGGGVSPSAFVRDTQTGGMIDLGSLQSGWAGNATDLSEDSSVIVGFDSQMLNRKAWVWTAGDGIIGLQERLAAQGIVGVPNLLTCNAVSVDGTVMVGGGEIGGGAFGTAGYIAELPTTPALWINLLGGLPGTVGVPKLAGTGTLVGGTPANVTLTKGKPLAPSALAVGLTAAQIPFKGGILVPHPGWIFFFPLGSTGSLSLNFNWPNGLPSGFKMYWQFMIKDAAALNGVALSNALRSQTP
ncbi:MAG TPA: hypothetical protein VFD43_12790, partial [Planctomycetota bacterium]|nr:hypothetical protein [Planctomycetota bacterium]